MGNKQTEVLNKLNINDIFVPYGSHTAVVEGNAALFKITITLPLVWGLRSEAVFQRGQCPKQGIARPRKLLIDTCSLIFPCSQNLNC